MLGRIVEVIFCVLLLPLFVVLVPPIWLAGRLGGYESVFFRQTRVGVRERPFTLIKFRTLKKSHQTSFIDPFFRLVRRLGIDEIPQILCIIGGRMSWVGPRPLVEKDLYLQAADGHPRQMRLVQLRQSVKPGLTGLAQLGGDDRRRDARSDQAFFDLDLWYVHNRSAALDLKLALRTILFVTSLGRKGRGCLPRDDAVGGEIASCSLGSRRCR
jgi:sugar transferase EpsL